MEEQATSEREKKSGSTLGLSNNTVHQTACWELRRVFKILVVEPNESQCSVCSHTIIHSYAYTHVRPSSHTPLSPRETEAVNNNDLYYQKMTEIPSKNNNKKTICLLIRNQTTSNFSYSGYSKHTKTILHSR